MQRTCTVAVALLACTAVIAFTAAQTTEAASPWSRPSGPESAPAHGSAVAAVSPLLQLVGSRESRFYGNLDVISQKTRLESRAVTVRCPGPATCTLAADPQVQIQAKGADNYWAVCLSIHGEFSDTPCPWIGELPEDGAFTIGGYRQTKGGLAPGTYKMHSVVYVESEEATIHNYSIVYSVYSER